MALMLGGCAWRPSLADYARLPPRSPAERGLDVRFLGTTSFLISDEHTSLVFDGFVSRPDAAAVLLGPVHSDPIEIKRHVLDHLRGPLAAIFVAHTHFDHALDIWNLADRTTAPIFGSEDLAALLPENRPYQPLPLKHPMAFGRFTVTAFQTGHSPQDLAPGRMQGRLNTPAHSLAYRTGLNFAYLVEYGACSMLIVPSAGEMNGAFAGRSADIVFLSIGRLGRQSPRQVWRYWEQTVTATGASFVVPIHWDDPSRSLDEPALATPHLLDRIDSALTMIDAFAGSSVQVRLPEPATVLDFSDADAGDCRHA